MAGATLWDEYRAAWRRRPWLPIFAVVGALCVIVSIVGTVARDATAILFIPGLGLLYMHHLLVVRSAKG